MHTQLVQKQNKRLFAVFASQVHQELREVLLVGDLCVNVEEAHARVSGHGGDHRSEARVNFILVNFQVCKLSTPFCQLDCLFRKDGLVDVENFSWTFEFFSQLCQHIGALEDESYLNRSRPDFHLAYFFSADPVAEVESAETCCGNSFVWEPAVEQHGSLLQSSTGPLFEGERFEEEVSVFL